MGSVSIRGKMKRAFLLLTVLVLIGCSDPMDKPAKAEQIEKFHKIFEMYPVLRQDFVHAESDGVVTKGELLAIGNKAVEMKNPKGAN